mgnify:CR=1 FL=1
MDDAKRIIWGVTFRPKRAPMINFDELTNLERAQMLFYHEQTHIEHSPFYTFVRENKQPLACPECLLTLLINCTLEP